MTDIEKEIDELNKQIDILALIIAELATKIIIHGESYRIKYLVAITKFMALKSRELMLQYELKGTSSSLPTYEELGQIESLAETIKEDDVSLVSIFDFAKFLRGLESKTIHVEGDDRLTV